MDPRPECSSTAAARRSTVTWSTICSRQQGCGSLEGVARYAGDTMQASVTTHIPQGDGKTMQTSQRITDLSRPLRAK